MITLTAGTATTNVQYKGVNGEYEYIVNVSKSDNVLQSINGTITKKTTDGVASAGNFNKYQQNPTNYSLDGTIAEKQALIADIDDIINQVNA